MKRKGFASVAALICLALVGVTITGVMLRLSNQAHRTAREMDRAQSEQIEIARSMGKTIKLPDELKPN